MKPNYEEMVEKSVLLLNVNISDEDKKSLILLLKNTNSLVKLLNNNEENYELKSTQVIAHIISSFFMELYVSGKISFGE